MMVTQGATPPTGCVSGCYLKLSEGLICSFTSKLVE